MRFWFFIILYLKINLLASCQNSYFNKDVESDISEKNFFRIGTKVVELQKHGESGNQNYFFLTIHDNEQTAITTSSEFITTMGGSYYQLVNDAQRNINFSWNHQTFTIDPNRIFTDIGILKTIKPEPAPGVVSAVSQFASFIISHLPADKTIVAVHNNTDGEYSINSYAKELSSDAAKLHINEDWDEDDFFITTHPVIFEKLKEKNVNVVLQSDNATDDGSLSVYSALKNRDYINIEAQHGHNEQQFNMIALVDAILKEGIKAK
ncbi:MAG: protein tyrosine phosphatase [Bacteroidota bacterium]|nr:protein tyrosine phosphatase [Bacteroidota bacterium]